MARPVIPRDTSLSEQHALIEAGTAGNVRLRLTMGASGTGTPLRDSYFKVRRLAAGNVGTYVA